jgi:hypothetical protein
MKQIIRKFLLCDRLRNWAENRKQVSARVEWERAGKPMPPPHRVKQGVLRAYSAKFGLRILAETGTYLGDMVEAMRWHFDRIYSIELSQELFEKARRRFAGVENVHLIQGDSGIVLAGVLQQIDQPALFWLDGHYSAGVTAQGQKSTPIYEELQHILNAPYHAHVIIIDDARLFGTDPAYPSIAELSEFVKAKRSTVDIVVQDDSIRITPRHDG